MLKSVEGLIGNYEVAIGHKGAEDKKIKVGTIVRGHWRAQVAIPRGVVRL